MKLFVKCNHYQALNIVLTKKKKKKKENNNTMGGVLVECRLLFFNHFLNNILYHHQTIQEFWKVKTAFEIYTTNTKRDQLIKVFPS